MKVIEVEMVLPVRRVTVLYIRHSFMMSERLMLCSSNVGELIVSNYVAVSINN